MRSRPRSRQRSLEIRGAIMPAPCSSAELARLRWSCSHRTGGDSPSVEACRDSGTAHNGHRDERRPRWVARPGEPTPRYAVVHLRSVATRLCLGRLGVSPTAKSRATAAASRTFRWGTGRRYLFRSRVPPAHRRQQNPRSEYLTMSGHHWTRPTAPSQHVQNQERVPRSPSLGAERPVSSSTSGRR